MKNIVKIYYPSQLNKFIDEHCKIPDTFNLMSNRNPTYQDILNYNHFKYKIVKDKFGDYLEIEL